VLGDSAKSKSAIDGERIKFEGISCELLSLAIDGGAKDSGGTRLSAPLQQPKNIRQLPDCKYIRQDFCRHLQLWGLRGRRAPLQKHGRSCARRCSSVDAQIGIDSDPR